MLFYTFTHAVLAATVTFDENIMESERLVLFATFAFFWFVLVAVDLSASFLCYATELLFDTCCAPDER